MARIQLFNQPQAPVNERQNAAALLQQAERRKQLAQTLAPGKANPGIAGGLDQILRGFMSGYQLNKQGEAEDQASGAQEEQRRQLAATIQQGIQAMTGTQGSPGGMSALAQVLASNPDTAGMGLEALMSSQPRPEKAPDMVRQYEYARNNGYKGSFEDFKGITKPETNITANVNTAGGAFSKEFGKLNAQQFFELRASAQDAAQSLRATQEALGLIDRGIISGALADWKLSFGKALQQAGIGVADDAIANTEAFAASRAQEVGRIIKLFGAGTGLSDADREFATKAAAGQITLNEESIRRILDINQRASTNILTTFNEQAESISPDLSPYPLTIDAPEAKASETVYEIRGGKLVPVQ